MAKPTLAEVLESVEEMHRDLKTKIKHEPTQTPHLLDAENYLRMAIPLLRGAKAKTDQHDAE